MKEDVIDVEITEDGLIKSTTPKISAANHSGAHQFFAFLARLTGGATETRKRDKHTDHSHVEHDHQKGSN